jgi:putative addiction module component (TIGR02574 family)
MNQRIDQLLQSALALSDAEQLEFVAALNAAVEERGLRPFDDAWVSEIQRRSAEYDAGLVKTIPWEEVKRRGRREVFKSE